ncbi:MAG: S41 family peptidase [Gemmatimonadetes bacterium]|nr:S41 family peptidase [Gemmatimonadota bacterium]MCY3676883.1 S41 family peptidase [Gemmatimonadota bacterium]MYA40819.1 S41 family peptidase [Gemmatimonadota bacterium]MYE94774.1 S41 family peptidase [Gemmatimonadota bacterium]MYJ11260.1 S41 family peptidase [Gemmatimonadota bacterium]
MKVTKTTVVPAMLVVLALTSGGWLLQRDVGMDANVYFQTRLLEEVVSRIDRYFVDEVQVDELYQAALRGVVEQLGDRNSQFLEASDWENVRIRTQGEYGGVGLEVDERDDHLTIVAPIPGTPGARAGLRPGDRIVEVDGASVEGWSIDRAVDLLRGAPGTTVTMGIRRPGMDRVMSFDVTREVIQFPSVPFATMLGGGVGYVPLRIFNGTTTAEVRSAIDSLAAEGMTSLVLDLRNNRGGLLTEGVGLADLFLDEGMDIVEIRGRNTAPEIYRARDGQGYPDLPIVVLIGHGSASAAEIVAGALQDQDRALLVGATSFGKGSVQSLFQLSGGNVLKLTTARWYTPSGRSIQKEPADQLARAESGVVTLPGDAAERPSLADKPEFRSSGGRLLHGGGGIVPDMWVLQDTLTTEEYAAVRKIFEAGPGFHVALQNWAVHYIQAHPELQPGFRITDADLASFHAALLERGAELSFDDLVGARRYVDFHLGAEIALQAWEDRGRFDRTAAGDLQLGRAIELLQAADDRLELFDLAGIPLASGSAGVAGSPGGSASRH